MNTIGLTDGAQRPGGDSKVEKTDCESKLIISAPFHSGKARSAAAGVRRLLSFNNERNELTAMPVNDEILARMD